MRAGEGGIDGWLTWISRLSCKLGGEKNERTKELATFPVVFCFDEKYSRYAAVAIYSLVLKNPKKTKIYFIAPRSAQASVRPIEKIGEQFGEEIQPIFIDADKFAEFRTYPGLTRATYFRLLIPEVISEDKVIYLDCDTIIESDLSELYDVCFDSGILFAGVPDLGGEQQSRIPRIQGDRYLNTGVLLINNAELRKRSLLERAAEIKTKYDRLILYGDQCIINKIAEGKKAILKDRWNKFIWSNSIERAHWLFASEQSEKGVLHFIGPDKPWDGWCNPLVSAYWWRFASDLQIPDLVPTQPVTAEQVVSLAALLDRYEDYKAASEVKGNLIKALISKLTQTT